MRDLPKELEGPGIIVPEQLSEWAAAVSVGMFASRAKRRNTLLGLRPIPIVIYRQGP